MPKALIYDDTKSEAPSPRKLRVFLAEKGIGPPDVEYVQIDIHQRESRTPEFKAKNALGNVPVLELEDGTCIADSMAICRYFEALHPDPPLFGRTPVEKGRVEMWVRRAELNLYIPMDFVGAFEDLPDAAARFRKAGNWFMGFLDRVLEEREFIVGDAYTAADVFAFVSLDYGITHTGYALAPEHQQLRRWHAAMRARPSANA